MNKKYKKSLETKLKIAHKVGVILDKVKLIMDKYPKALRMQTDSTNGYIFIIDLDYLE